MITSPVTGMLAQPCNISAFLDKIDNTDPVYFPVLTLPVRRSPAVLSKRYFVIPFRLLSEPFVFPRPVNRYFTFFLFLFELRRRHFWILEESDLAAFLSALFIFSDVSKFSGCFSDSDRPCRKTQDMSLFHVLRVFSDKRRHPFCHAVCFRT